MTSLKELYDNTFLEIIAEDVTKIDEECNLPYNSTLVLSTLKEKGVYKGVFKKEYHQKLEHIRILNKLKNIFLDTFLHKNIAELLQSYRIYSLISGNKDFIPKLDVLIMYLNSGNTKDLLVLVEEIFSVSCLSDDQSEYTLFKIFKDISNLF